MDEGRGEETKYVFDTGPFIDLRNYPKDIFKSLWDSFEDMLYEQRIISSIEVFREITNYDDEIAGWAKIQKSIFVKPTLEEQEIVADILLKYPNLIKERDILKGNPTADPIRNCSSIHQ